MSVAPEVYRFGCWQLDTRRRVLCAEGTIVSLNGRAFDILAMLVTRNGELVTRDEIVAHVWGGVVVGENNLTVQMSTLRRTLGEGADGAPMIVTVPGRGYRFTCELVGDVLIGSLQPDGSAPVLQLQSSPPPQRSPLAVTARVNTAAVSGLFAAVLAIGAVVLSVYSPPSPAPRLSIAVLPFRNLSADHAQDYIADALTDDLTTDLAHIPGSTVIAREGVDAYRSVPVSTKQIGHSLGVRYLVKGSMLIEEGHYHVNAQLIDAESGIHLWAANFDPARGRTSEARRDLIGQIATALDIRLTTAESIRSLHDRPDNGDALDLFFRARATLDSSDSLSSMAKAQTLLEQALKKEPDFGDAMALLGALLLTKVEHTDDPDETRDFSEAHELIRQALTLSPRNSDALAARGRELAHDGRWVEAAYSARASLDVEPSNVEALSVLSTCDRAQGNLENAASRLLAILDLTLDSPLNKPRYSTLGYIRLMQLKTKEAADYLQRAVAGDDESGVSEAMGRAEWTSLLLVAAAAMEGNLDDARAQFKAYNTRWKNRTVWRIAGYLGHADQKFPGYKAFLDGLRAAGMPAMADENDSIALPAIRCPGGDFDVTPTTIKDATIWDTARVSRSLNQNLPPLVIDIGRGISVPPGATWLDTSQTTETFERFAERLVTDYASRFPSGYTVIMGDGPFGCSAYKVASVLAKDGFAKIAWYRGGEEAWARAGMPSYDRRL